MASIRASLIPQSVKNLPAVQETRVRSLGWENPLEKEMATHSSILAWKISWTEEPGGLQSMGSQRVRHDWVINTNYASIKTYKTFWNSHQKKKNGLVIIGEWNTKVGSQEIPGVTGKFGLGVQNEAGQRLTEFCQKNALVTAFFLWHKRWLYTWTSPDGQYRNQIDWLYSLQPKMEKLYTVGKNKTRSWLWLRSWTPYCKIQT